MAGLWPFVAGLCQGLAGVCRWVAVVCHLFGGGWVLWPSVAFGGRGEWRSPCFGATMVRTGPLRAAQRRSSAALDRFSRLILAGDLSVPIVISFRTGSSLRPSIVSDSHSPAVNSCLSLGGEMNPRGSFHPLFRGAGQGPGSVARSGGGAAAPIILPRRSGPATGVNRGLAGDLDFPFVGKSAKVWDAW